MTQHGGAQALPVSDTQWGPYVVTTTPAGKTWTRTYTSPDGTVITEVCVLSAFSCHSQLNDCVRVARPAICSCLTCSLSQKNALNSHWNVKV